MKFLQTLTALILFSSIATAGTQVEPERALQLLATQSQQFEKKVVQLTPNVFTAVGYHGATTSMIVGEDGVIIVDTLMGPASAAEALADFRKHSDKPVKAIIYTHSHGDHTGGAAAFMDQTEVEVYARDGFANATGTEPALRPLAMKRGTRQFGRKLPKHEQTNRGVAPAQTMDGDRGKGHIPPTILVGAESRALTIAGVAIEIHAAPGETDDAIFIWLPEEKVLFSGDNFYQSFPNLYAIRGTGYRDVMKWSKSVAKMATFEPEHLVGGHTMPISGKAAATSALQSYSDAIRYVYDQTVTGMNQGKSPDMIANEIQLVDSPPHLTEFYGSVAHASRAIYAGLLGWYDGNPTNLNRLHPRDEAKNIARLAGGTKQLIRNMKSSMENGDYQWALQLADHLKWLEDGDRELARETKIAALRALGAREYNAPNRNYYLSYANELESGELIDIWF